MENIHEFPNREAIAEEAAEWLIRLDGDRSPRQEDLQALREWMQRSPAHREELISLSEFWSDQSLTALPIELKDLAYPQSDQQNHDSAAFWQRLLRAPAMAFVLVLGLGMTFFNNPQWLPSGWRPYAEQTGLYATAIGQQSAHTLLDGSVIYLNTNSQVRVDYSAESRSIHLLQGEAHFEVAKQAARPFRVYAGGGRVQAVGTAFTVYLRGDDVDVSVNEGVVALGAYAKASGEGGAAQLPAVPKLAQAASEPGTSGPEYYLAIPVDELGLLEAGEVTTILVAEESAAGERNQLDTVKKVAEEELDRRGAWRSGLLVFSGQSLEEVVKELARYTTLSIAIVDPEIKSMRIGGRFSAANTEDLFDALEANFGLKITYLDYQRVEISVADKKPHKKTNP